MHCIDLIILIYENLRRTISEIKSNTFKKIYTPNNIGDRYEGKKDADKKRNL